MEFYMNIFIDILNFLYLIIIIYNEITKKYSKLLNFILFIKIDKNFSLFSYK